MPPERLRISISGVSGLPGGVQEIHILGTTTACAGAWAVSWGESYAARQLLLTRMEPSGAEGGAAVIPPVGLTVRGVGANGRHTLVLAGELDIASAPMLEAAVAEMPASGTSALVLDLSEVTFMDSSGLKAVLATYKRCQEHEREFSLAGASDSVLRVLDMTGVSRAIGLGGEDSSNAAP